MKNIRTIAISILGTTALAMSFQTSIARKSSAPDDIYLSEFERYLQEFPRDGNFGPSRLPTIHGNRSIPEANAPLIEKAFKEIEQDNFLASMTFGRLDQPEFRYSTMPSHHNLDEIPTQAIAPGIRMAMDAENNFYGVSMRNAIIAHLKKGKVVSTAKVPYGNLQAMVKFRSVNANDKNCLRCHTEVQFKKPIGVIALVTISRASVPPVENLPEPTK